MSDLLKEINYLRFYYASDDAMKDKDFCKNEAFEQYNRKTQALFVVPMVFQMWQISLANVAAKVSLYKQVRLFKSASIIGACSIGLWEYTTLRKKMLMYDRLNPEPTELQRKLQVEAAMFKEQAYV